MQQALSSLGSTIRRTFFAGPAPTAQPPPAPTARAKRRVQEGEESGKGEPERRVAARTEREGVAPLSLISQAQRNLPGRHSTPRKTQERIVASKPPPVLNPSSIVFSPLDKDKEAVFLLDDHTAVHWRAREAIRRLEQRSAATADENAQGAEGAKTTPSVNVATPLALRSRPQDTPLKMIEAMDQVEALESSPVKPQVFRFQKRDLTLEEQRSLEDAWDENKDRCEILAENKLAVVTRESIQRLRDGCWINDEVVNWEFSELQMQCASKQALFFSSFFYMFLSSPKYDYSKVRRWTKSVNVFAYEKIVVPVHLVNHWVVAVVNLRDKRFEYFDSLDGRGNLVLNNLRRWLLDESIDKRSTTFDECRSWPLIDTPDSAPKQNNAVDCGVFAMRYAATVALDLPADFSQDDIGWIRRMYVVKIMKSADAGEAS